MAKKANETNPVKQLSTALSEMMTELFGECKEVDGNLRSIVDNLGVVNGNAIVEVGLEGGIREEAPYGVLHFHTTLAENIPEEAVADLILSLNGLNHVINAGAYPAFGSFVYYYPLSQVYLSYRMPVNLNQIEADFDNIRYYLGVLYDQLDLLMDFIMFTIADPGAMTIGDYMEYLDEVSDLDSLEERFKALEGTMREMAADVGIDYDNVETEEDDE